MRLLIIDDEEHVIDTIRLLVDWTSLGFDQVMECTDAAAAMALVKEFQPNLVLTDMMMPKVHGTELVEHISSVDASIKIIVISGHSDFNYIQHTLRHGGLDYITKPIMEEQLLEAANKAVERIKEEGSAAAAMKKVYQLDPIYWDQVFSDIYEGKPINEQSVQQLSAIYNLKSETTFRTGVLELKDYETLLSRSFGNDRKLMDFALKNICQEVIDASVMDGYVSRNSDNDQHLLIMVWGHVKALEMVAASITQTIKDIYDIEGCVSVSGSYVFPESVSKAKSEVVSVVKNKNLLQPMKGIYRLAEVDTRDMELPIIDPNPILIAMKSKNRQLLEDAVHESFKDVRRLPFIREVDLKEMVASFERCLSYCCEKLEIRKNEWDLNIPKHLFFSSALPDDLEKVFGSSAAHIMAAYTKVSSQEGDTIEGVKKYLDENYHSQLNMVQLSGEFAISKEHLSRQFKKRYGKTVIEYVTELRLDAACNHLKGLNLSIREVSMLVGYQDEKYFSKVFKKHTGLSPKDYRKAHQ